MSDYFEVVYQAKGNIKKHGTLASTSAISTKVYFNHVTVHKIQKCKVLTNLHKTKGVPFSEKFLFLDRVIFFRLSKFWFQQSRL